MIAATLVPDEALQMPFDDNQQRFLHIAQIARKNLQDITNGGGMGSYSSVNWNAQYVHELSEIGDALGISGLPDYPSSAQLNSDQLAAFDVALARVLTRIRISSVQPPKFESVRLSVTTKTTIMAEIERLKAMVNKSNLSDALKSSLHKKIEAVEAELDKKRSALHPLWILSGALTMLSASSDIVGTFADLRPAVELLSGISRSFDDDKKSEIAEDKRLEGELFRIGHVETKAITDQR